MKLNKMKNTYTNLFKNDSHCQEYYLHFKANKLMEKLDEKYKMNNTLSLDEYLFDYCDLLTNEEQLEVCNLIAEFNNL